MVAQPIATMTEEEYLAFEETSETKHEYIDGRVYAMAGASEPHIAIVGSIHFRLYGQLRGRPCRAYMNEMRVRLGLAGMYGYPDLVVVCGERAFSAPPSSALLNPTVIVEVLSPSTEVYDRSAKWLRYQRIESLRDYLLIAQDAPRIEHFIRQDGGIWSYYAAGGLDATIELPAIGCTLSLADVYENVAFA